MLSALAILVPLALQLLGVLPSSYAFVDGTMQVRSWLVDIHEVPVLVFLALSGVLLVVTPSLALIRYVRALDESRQRLHLSTWHMQQLLPQVARRWIA